MIKEFIKSVGRLSPVRIYKSYKQRWADLWLANAIFDYNYDACAKALKQGANPNADVYDLNPFGRREKVSKSILDRVKQQSSWAELSALSQASAHSKDEDWARERYAFYVERTTQIAKLLLENGMDISGRDEYGETLLHHLANEINEGANREFFSVAIEYTDLRHQVSYAGVTPLHYLAAQCEKKSGEAMLEFQAELYSKFCNNRVALESVYMQRDTNGFTFGNLLQQVTHDIGIEAYPRIKWPNSIMLTYFQNIAGSSEFPEAFRFYGDPLESGAYTIPRITKDNPKALQLD